MINRDDAINRELTRRSVLLSAVQVPFGGALMLGLVSCGDESVQSSQIVCADPDNMSASEVRMRASLDYVPQSPDPEQSCAYCTYYTDGAGDCGSCALLSGGQVSGMGRCISWSARDA